MGYSRQQFYEIRRNFQTYGAEGLIDQVAHRERHEADVAGADAAVAEWNPRFARLPPPRSARCQQR
jgi:hypothetical protein